MKARRTSRKSTMSKVLILVVVLGLGAIVFQQSRSNRSFGGSSISSMWVGRSFDELDRSSTERRPMLDTSGLNTVGAHIPS